MCGSCPQSQEVGLRVVAPQKAAWLVPGYWELAGAEGSSELTASSQLTSVGGD